MFFEDKRAALGLPAYRKMVARLMYEAGIDVSDIYNKRIERVADVRRKRAIGELTANDVVRVLWGVLDTGTGGRLTKSDIACSPLGEALMPYWSQLDTNADGGVTKAELEAYLAAVEQRNPPGYKSWVVDMLYDGDLADVALQAITEREQLERKAPLRASLIRQP